MIGLIFVWSLPAYEDSCKLKLEIDMDAVQLTDSSLINQRVNCQNYFNGHVIAEYWSICIVIVIAFSLIWSLTLLSITDY